MSIKTTFLALAVGLATCSVALAAPLKLTPASPQPGNLKPGLSVRYAYPVDVKSLADAERALKYKSEAGAPLTGLDFHGKGFFAGLAPDV